MTDEIENVGDIYSGGNFLKSDDVQPGAKLSCKIKAVSIKEFGKEDKQSNRYCRRNNTKKKSL